MSASDLDLALLGDDPNSPFLNGASEPAERDPEIDVHAALRASTAPVPAAPDPFAGDPDLEKAGQATYEREATLAELEARAEVGDAAVVAMDIERATEVFNEGDEFQSLVQAQAILESYGDEEGQQVLAEAWLATYTEEMEEDPRGVADAFFSMVAQARQAAQRADLETAGAILESELQRKEADYAQAVGVHEHMKVLGALYARGLDPGTAEYESAAALVGTALRAHGLNPALMSGEAVINFATDVLTEAELMPRVQAERAMKQSWLEDDLKTNLGVGYGSTAIPQLRPVVTREMIDANRDPVAKTIKARGAVDEWKRRTFGDSPSDVEKEIGAQRRAAEDENLRRKQLLGGHRG